MSLKAMAIGGLGAAAFIAATLTAGLLTIPQASQMDTGMAMAFAAIFGIPGTILGSLAGKAVQDLWPGRRDNRCNSAVLQSQQAIPSQRHQKRHNPMTSTAIVELKPQQEPIRDLLCELAAAEAQGSTITVSSQATSAPEPSWLPNAATQIASLLGNDEDLPDGRTQPSAAPAATLLRLLTHILRPDNPPPSGVTATWEGGLTAEWHIGQIDLEITCQPDGTSDFSFENRRTGDQRDAPINDDLSEVRGYAGTLPERSPRAPTE